MSPSAIVAQLVDMRNVGTHKVLRLTLHVPQEQALAAIAAFGWPTEVEPVPVAIARLAQTPTAAAENLDAAKARKLIQRLALAGKEPGFWQFLNETHAGAFVVDDEHRAAMRVRQLLGVASRREVAHDHDVAQRAQALLEQYGAWLRAPEVVP